MNGGQTPTTVVSGSLPIEGRGLSSSTRDTRPKRRRGQRLFFILYLAPSLWALAFYGFFATDRYVSESSFIVRSATRSSFDGFAAFLRMIGVSSSQDDTFAVHDFILSRDAVSQLLPQIDLRVVYGNQNADRLSRYPNLFFGNSADEFQRYLKSRISVRFNSNTGISTLLVEAFSPEEAQKVSAALLELAEKMINRINGRIHQDAVVFSTEEVKHAEERLRKIQLELTEFRNREIQIDPNRSSVLVMELVAKLMDELSRVTAQLAETLASSPNSPQVPSLERRAEALRAQIARERGRVTDQSDGLAKKIARFEEFNLEREFAAKALASAIVGLDTARGEARRQQLYLERISGPSRPDKALMPQRMFEIVSIMITNLVILLVGWLVRTGIAEHAPSIEVDVK